MIKLTNIYKQYLGEDLLKDVTWHMKPGEKIGLIGPNGTGKTTQLRIICGMEEADSGDVYVAPGVSIGYLSQEPIVDSDNTLNEELYSVFVDVLDAEKAIHILQHDLSALQPGELLDQKLAQIAQLQEFFELNEGYSIHAKVGQIISGLGFSEQDRSSLIQTFSGGWQMRVSIAKMLLESPDLLLLDEPTNHLDIKAIEWLESYLATYKGGYIIVSHDRQFLNRTAERILEVDGIHVKSYWGNYDKYFEEKERRYEEQLAAYKLQQEKIAKEKAFINKFRASAARSSQAKSRERQLEKVEIIKPPTRQRGVKFSFPVDIKSGEDVMKFVHLKKAYDSNVIFEDLNLEIKNGDKIALIGENGSGKTTLMRIIMGLDKNYTGKVKPGHLVDIMYFSQHEARALSGDKSVFESLHDSAPSYTNEQVRTILGRFGITGDNVFKTLSGLSGGEKARIALSKMLMAGANFLLFDEPTNHLDISAKEALEQAINDFEGTVIVISHDRKFIDNIATKIFAIENKDISVCMGNYSYYKYIKDKENNLLQNQEAVLERKTDRTSGIIKHQECQSSSKDKALSPKMIEKLIIKTEKDIINIEEEITNLEQKLEDTTFYQQSPEEFVKCSSKLDALKAELELLNDKWCDLIET